jgi:hypothetical protein
LGVDDADDDAGDFGGVFGCEVSKPGRDLVHEVGVLGLVAGRALLLVGLAGVGEVLVPVVKEPGRTADDYLGHEYVVEEQQVDEMDNVASVLTRWIRAGQRCATVPQGTSQVPVGWGTVGTVQCVGFGRSWCGSTASG